MKKILHWFNAAGLLAGVFFVLVSSPAPAEKLPLDDRGRPIQVLKFGGPLVTQSITYDNISRRGASPDYVFESGSVGTTIVRIYCNSDAHVTIETSLDAIQNATTQDTPIAADVYQDVTITSSNDRFAVVRQTADGTCWFTPLE